MPDMNKAARKANAKLQALENNRAAAEGRAPRDLKAERIAARKEL